MSKDLAELDGALKGTTVMEVLFLPLQPSFESEKIGPDLPCFLLVPARACHIVNKVEGMPTSNRQWDCFPDSLWATWTTLCSHDLLTALRRPAC